MIMVTGSSFQNKTAYALKVTGLMESDIIDGAECTEKDALEAKGIRNYHTFIKRFFLNGGDPLVFTEKLCRRSVEVVIMDEIGCGIVPIDRNDRAIREAVGRCGCIIAENSHTVVRVCCGIPTIIKGAENDHQPYTSR